MYSVRTSGVGLLKKKNKKKTKTVIQLSFKIVFSQDRTVSPLYPFTTIATKSVTNLLSSKTPENAENSF